MTHYGWMATIAGLLTLLLIFDWRLGLLSLVPVALAFAVMTSMTGKEMQDKMTQYQNARAKTDLRINQIEAMARAVESTELLMQHGSTTYLEVLTAQQSLLSAQLSQIADRFDEIQGVVNLYQALGGGRDLTEEE